MRHDTQAYERYGSKFEAYTDHSTKTTETMHKPITSQHQNMVSTSLTKIMHLIFQTFVVSFYNHLNNINSSKNMIKDLFVMHPKLIAQVLGCLNIGMFMV